MNRKLLLAAGITAMLGAGLLVWVQPHSSPTILGELSKEDFSRIQEITRREMWRPAFPTNSWQVTKQLPRWLCRLATSRIRQVETLKGKDWVQVQMGSPFGDYYYLVHKRLEDKGSWDWRVLMAGPERLANGFFFSATNSTPKAPLSEAGFSASLSNRTKITLDH